MIPDNLKNNQTLFRIMQSSLIGLPSPSALLMDKFPGVRIGLDPVMGNHCIIFGNVFIGNQFRCGNNVLIRDNISIGDEVTIGNGSFIDSDVVVADSAIIGDAVNVSRSVRIGSGVVIGDNVRFLTSPIRFPITARKRRGTVLEDGCTIGPDTVLAPGVHVGAGAIVESGSVVTEDIP